jgi:hypothetical protein
MVESLDASLRWHDEVSHQNPTSRSISARMLAGDGSAHSISLG